jgi:acetylornithine deacetylase
MDTIKSYIDLLREMIRTASFSGEEAGVAELIRAFLADRGVETLARGNNVIARNRFFTPGRPTILLNSHLDTVRPNAGYTRDPFDPAVEGDRLYGLGSTDAGASVVSLIATFLHFYPQEGMAYNLCLALTAEEERSGVGGIESVWNELTPIDFAIVGEPTEMQMAVAEKGLLVIDCTAQGQSGHAARREGVNAIYKAAREIAWFETFRFPEVSPWLGEVNMAVTIVNGGTQHNVIPAECTYTVDLRLTERYSHEEVLEIIRSHVESRVTPRSVRLRPSSIAVEHPLVQAGLRLGLRAFGSPTLSDQALIPAPSLKIGPGRSQRSHTADEYVLISEIETGIKTYIDLLNSIL